jgi:hypothetical protein
MLNQENVVYDVDDEERNGASQNPVTATQYTEEFFLRTR